jgi:hypothetical protein
MMKTQVLHLSAWRDPGVLATDADAYGVVRDITHAVSAEGVAKVDTGSPTPPGVAYSFRITYTVRSLHRPYIPSSVLSS